MAYRRLLAARRYLAIGAGPFALSLPAGVYSADVATDIELVTAAWGTPLLDPVTGSTLHPGTFGDVLAQTPELDSLVLFGLGAAGMASYALTRIRSRRRRASMGD